MISVNTGLMINDAELVLEIATGEMYFYSGIYTADVALAAKAVDANGNVSYVNWSPQDIDADIVSDDDHFYFAGAVFLNSANYEEYGVPHVLYHAPSAKMYQVAFRRQEEDPTPPAVSIMATCNGAEAVLKGVRLAPSYRAARIISLIGSGGVTADGSPKVYATQEGGTLTLTIDRQPDSADETVGKLITKAELWMPEESVKDGDGSATYKSVKVEEVTIESDRTEILLTAEKWLPYMTDRADSTGWISGHYRPELKLFTYNVAGEQVGTTKEIRFDIFAPDEDYTRPSVSMTLQASNGALPSTFDGLFIQYKSKVQAAIAASGQYGAAIAGSSMQLLGNAYISPYLSDLLSASGDVVVSAQAQDTRGLIGTIEQTITVHPYKRPKILPYTGQNVIVCARCKADGTLASSGTSLLLMAARSYSTIISGGVQKNFCAMQYRIKEKGADDSAYSAWTTILPREDVFANEVSYVAADAVPLVTKSYTVQLLVADDIGERYVIELVVPTDTIALDLGEGGRKVAVGKYAEKEGIFEVALNAEFQGTVMLGETTLTEAQLVALLDLIKE